MKACGFLREDVKTVMQTAQTESHIDSPNTAESSVHVNVVLDSCSLQKHVCMCTERAMVATDPLMSPIVLRITHGWYLP